MPPRRGEGHRTCGGRALNDDVMDTVFTLLVNGGEQASDPRRHRPGHPCSPRAGSPPGANGDGYGALLCFSADGKLAGPFGQDRRIIDPRGRSLTPAGDLVYVNSGDERVLALDTHGKVVLDSGRTGGLDPGRGHSGRTAATASGCGGAGRSWPRHLISIPKAGLSCPTASSRSREPSRLDDVRLLRARRYSADAPGRTAGSSGIPRDKSSFSCRGVPACR